MAKARSTRGGVLVPELPLDAEENTQRRRDTGRLQAIQGSGGAHRRSGMDGFMAEAARSSGPRPDLARNDGEDLRGSSTRAVATVVT